MIGVLLNAQLFMFSKISDGTIFGWIVHLSGKSVLIPEDLPPENSKFNINKETLNEVFTNFETHARKIG